MLCASQSCLKLLSSRIRSETAFFYASQQLHDCLWLVRLSRSIIMRLSGD